jgi:hypothetical protein
MVMVTGAGGVFCDIAWPPFGVMPPPEDVELSLPGAEFWFWVWLGLLQATPNTSSKLTANPAMRNLIESPFQLINDDGLAVPY